MFNKKPSGPRGRTSSDRNPSDRPARRPASASSFSSRPRTTAGNGEKKFRQPDTVGELYPSQSRRPSFGGSASRGSSFGGGNRRPSFGSRRPAKKLGEHIDVSRFINRATTVIEEVYTPVHTFNDFNVDPKLKERIAARGFTIPSPIQDQAVPNALDGRDIIGLANTGTGKTAAFLIPTINKIIHDKKHKAIIITPTRELALQIQKECIELTRGLGIFNVTCVGGAPIRFQMENLARTHHIVIGTPGRLKDLLDRKKLNMSNISTVVLDEADRMLDMGFIDDVRYFLKHIEGERQMLLFSATMAPAIEKLVHEFLNNPVKISVKSRDTSKNVDQDIVRVADKTKKLDILAGLLQDSAFSKVLIFTETKRSVDKLHDELRARNYKCESIHGDKRHRERQSALRGFSDGKIQILIATDVAARGLDISGVTHVINYEIPQTYDTYVHRIGRTGRGSNKGSALTFV